MLRCAAVAFGSSPTETPIAVRMALSLREIRVAARAPNRGSELRLLYELFEEAQRTRIAHGERLRAILQGRCWLGPSSDDPDADALIKEVGRGGTAGAPRLLERAYARAVEDEASASIELRESIIDHPAWQWLSTVKGIGHLLAARLLSRLDVARASTPSAFWAYCGLATIPGVGYRCSQCGLEVAYPIGYQVRGPHHPPSATRLCPGELAPIPDASTRVAPRRSVIGGRAGFDARARESCYLVGVSMLRCGGDYRAHYDAERARLAVCRCGWTARRCHLAALRKMEKTFLRDLWIAWRRAVNLPIVAPYFPAHNNLPHSGRVNRSLCL